MNEKQEEKNGREVPCKREHFGNICKINVEKT
jgi:hypothetical protein